MSNTHVVDCWVNLNPDKNKLGGSVGYLFTEADGRLQSGESEDEIVELMRASGITKGLLTIDHNNPEPALKAIERHPGVFFGAMKVDPHKGMSELRRMTQFARDYPIKAVRVSGHYILKPYNDKIYYPVYAKCIELDLPITANVGIPGPLVPGAHQDPMALDEVCWFFPDLKVVMTHIGEPWHYTCVKLMLKWKNLYYMTSAFAPKYYPKEIIQYLNTRGSKKVMFASDYPLIGFDRCMKEIAELKIREHVLPDFLHGNAERVFGI